MAATSDGHAAPRQPLPRSPSEGVARRLPPDRFTKIVPAGKSYRVEKRQRPPSSIQDQGLSASITSACRTGRRTTRRLSTRATTTPAPAARPPARRLTLHSSRTPVCSRRIVHGRGFLLPVVYGRSSAARSLRNREPGAPQVPPSGHGVALASRVMDGPVCRPSDVAHGTLTVSMRPEIAVRDSKCVAAASRKRCPPSRPIRRNPRHTPNWGSDSPRARKRGLRALVANPSARSR